MDIKSNLKVVIVGGSIGGLTLAHCFNRAGIDYVLLEKHANPAPLLGAGLGLFSNSARILDQLNLWQALEDCSGVWKRAGVYTKEGKKVFRFGGLPLLEKRLGYPGIVTNRQTLLQHLWDGLKDESRIYLNKQVTGVVHSDLGVIVKCHDGSQFAGDIVVGADGVRSGIRKEMRRYMSDHGHNHLLSNDELSMKADYKILFGSSKLPSTIDIDMKEGDFNRVPEKGATVQAMHGKDNNLWWIVGEKMPRTFTENEIPRFNPAEIKDQLQPYMDWHISSKLKMRTVFENADFCHEVALEEYSSDIWTWDRFVCLGDSMDKVAPQSGQGAGQTIEAAATLTNCLLAMLGQEGTGTPPLDSIKIALKAYQDFQRPRTHFISQMAREILRGDTKETSIWRNPTKLVEILRVDVFPEILTKAFVGAPKLDFLPEPTRSLQSTMAFDPNVGGAKSESLWLRAIYALPLLAVAYVGTRTFGAVLEQMVPLLQQASQARITVMNEEVSVPLISRVYGLPGFDDFIRILIAYFLPGVGGFDPLARLQSMAFLADIAPLLSIMWIERFRRGNSITAACAPVFFGLAMQIRGGAVVLPIYLALHYIQSPLEKYHAPDMRLTNIAGVKSLPLALTAGYLIPTFAMYSSSLSLPTRQWACGIWQLFPIWIWAFSRIFSIFFKDTTSSDRYDNPRADMKYLRMIYAISALVPAGTYFYMWAKSPYSMQNVFFTNVLRNPRAPIKYVESSMGQSLRYDQLCCFGAVFIWILLHFTDLKIARRTTLSWLVLLPVLVGTAFIAGPGTALACFWAWREEILAKGRKGNGVTTQDGKI